MEILNLRLEELNKVFEVVKTFVVCLLSLVHFNTRITLCNDNIELFFHNARARAISFKIVNFFHFSNLNLVRYC